MVTMTTSGLILTVCCIIIAIWDLIAVKRYGVKYSVSYYIQQTGVTHPTLIFAMGFLCGHFFAGMSINQ
jgi:hypothetical protein